MTRKLDFVHAHWTLALKDLSWQRFARAIGNALHGLIICVARNGLGQQLTGVLIPNQYYPCVSRIQRTPCTFEQRPHNPF